MAVTAAAGSRIVVVKYSEPAAPGATGTGAANPSAYSIGGAALVSGSTVTYDSAARATTIVLPDSVAGVASAAKVKVAGVTNAAGQAFPETEVEAPVDTDAPTASIGATVGSRVVLVKFSVAMTTATSSSGWVEDPNSYKLNSSAFPSQTGYSYSGTTMTITLPSSADPVKTGDVISVSGVKSTVGALVGRTSVKATVAGTPVSVVVVAQDARTFTVRFSEAVANGSGSGGAAALASYKLNEADLPSASTVTYVESTRMATVQLASGSTLNVGDRIGITGVTTTAGGLVPATVVTLAASSAAAATTTTTTTTLAGESATTTLCVDPPVLAADVDNESSDDLPRTGSNTADYVLIGSVALVGGELFRRWMLRR
jgi:hypothetical protein